MTREEAAMCLLDCFYKDGNGLIYVDCAMEEQFFEARHMAIEALLAQQDQCGLTNEQLGRLVSNSYAEGYEDCKAGKPPLEKRTEYKFGEWISVNDRLPDADVAVLARCFYHECWQTLVCHCSKRNTGRWYTNVAGQWVQVTHWMPLPQPPK